MELPQLLDKVLAGKLRAKGCGFIVNTDNNILIIEPPMALKATTEAQETRALGRLVRGYYPKAICLPSHQFGVFQVACNLK